MTKADLLKKPLRHSMFEMTELCRFHNVYTHVVVPGCLKQDVVGAKFSMVVNNIVRHCTPDCGLIEAQQYFSILLTTGNNVAPTTLLHPIFNHLQFLAVQNHCFSSRTCICNLQISNATSDISSHAIRKMINF